MDQPTPASAAPAQPAAPAPAPPATVSASTAAVNSGDFSAFQAAEQAKRQGKPLADVPAAPVTPDLPATPAAPAAPADAGVSKRQQAINDRIRQSVEAATADKDAEIARLRAQMEGRTPTAASPSASAPTPAQPTGADWKRLASHPDAPKLDDFTDSPNALGEHAAAMSVFVFQQLTQEAATAARTRSTEAAREDVLRVSSERFTSKLREAAQADPAFIDQIPPQVLRDAQGRDVLPVSALPPAQRDSATFANYVVEVALHSEDPAALLRYLGNPTNLQAVMAIAQQHPSRWESALTRLDGRLSAPARDGAPSAAASAAAPPSPISAAPAPPPVLTGAGTTVDQRASAIARGDFASFQRIEQQAREARRVA